MTMRMEDALEHFLSILDNALVTNSGNIETQRLVRSQWNSVNQNIHINHGSHFTSHFTIYDKVNPYSIHPYWGTHSDYHPLFSQFPPLKIYDY